MGAWCVDDSKFPGISSEGRQMLYRLSAHPHAPILRDHSGPSLSTEDCLSVRDFFTDVEKGSPWKSLCSPPDWLTEFVARTLKVVPYYRSKYPEGAAFDAITPIGRAQARIHVARFVPDDLPVDKLIVFSSSGTTGLPLSVPSHPIVAARYYAFHKRALGRVGIVPCAGAGEVAVVLAGYQKRCFTYASVNPLMDEAGLVKINLHPDEWRHPEDRARYIDSLAPELISGDPLSLAELAQLSITHRPRAILSTSMALSPATRASFESSFGCPVVNVYSMTEAGPIASWSDRHNGFLVLQNRLYIEILSPEGVPLPPGSRGEITLTGGFNDYFPLLRYRTGDYGWAEESPEGIVLRDVEGRPPVRFRAMNGVWLNNVDVTHALSPFDLVQYALHQKDNERFILSLRPRDLARKGELVQALKTLLGQGINVSVQTIKTDKKIIQYTTDLVLS